MLLFSVIVAMIAFVLYAARRDQTLDPPPPFSKPLPDWSTLPPERGSVTSQRDMMRQLYRQYGDDEERLIRAYADAEMSGEVRRKNNEYGLAPEEYARRLLADG